MNLEGWYFLLLNPIWVKELSLPVRLKSKAAACPRKAHKKPKEIKNSLRVMGMPLIDLDQ